MLFVYDILVRELERVGKFGNEIRISAGEIQRIGEISKRNQLKKVGAIDPAGKVELQIILFIQPVGSEQAREQAEWEVVGKGSIPVNQSTRIFRTFGSQTELITPLLERLAESRISCKYLIPELVVIGKPGYINVGVGSPVKEVITVIAVEISDGSPCSHLNFFGFGDWIDEIGLKSDKLIAAATCLPLQVRGGGVEVFSTEVTSIIGYRTVVVDVGGKFLAVFGEKVFEEELRAHIGVASF